jgi:hypothetical protein
MASLGTLLASYYFNGEEYYWLGARLTARNGNSFIFSAAENITGSVFFNSH